MPDGTATGPTAPERPGQGPAPAASEEEPKAPGRRKRAARPDRPLWQAALINVVLALVVVSLLQAFVVRVHNVSSGSMEQTLGVTDRVLSSNLPYLGGSPARGDIVIFAHGDTWETDVRSPDPNPLKQAVRYVGDVTGIGVSNRNYTVKRVVGVGGDTVECCTVDGRVTVNGQPQTEPYLYRDLIFRPGQMDCATTPRSSRCFGPIAVPPGKLFVLGDHRSNSADSATGCRRVDSDPDTCARFVGVGQVSGKVIARAWPPGPIG